MKKKLMMLMAAVMTAGMLAGCGVSTTKPAESPAPGNTAETSDNSLDYIKEKGKIIVGLDDSVPPMGFRDDNDEIVGVDIDLAKAVAEKMGVEAEFKAIDWKAKEMELSTKKIDVIWNGFTITDERKKNILFSDPYMEQTQAIVVPEGSDIKTKADLAGKKIGVQGSSSTEEAVLADKSVKINESDIVKYDTILLELTDLTAGRIDAVVADETVVRYTMSKTGDKYMILADNFAEEEYGIGFRLGEEEFKNAVQKAMDELKSEGKLKEISKKWFADENIIK